MPAGWAQINYFNALHVDPSVHCLLQYDNRAEDLTKEVRPVLQLGSELISVCVWYSTRQGMRQGIINSGAVIIFLSAGILSRPFCTCMQLVSGR